MHDAEVAFPDHGDAVEDGREQNALRQDAGSHEGEIADIAGGNAAHAAEHASEDHDPQNRLHGASQNFGGIAKELLQLDFGDGRGLLEKSKNRGRLGLSRDG